MRPDQSLHRFNISSLFLDLYVFDKGVGMTGYLLAGRLTGWLGGADDTYIDHMVG